MPKLLGLLAILALASACGSKTECENSLTVRDSDRGSTRAISDGCTSLIVSLARDATTSWAAAPTIADARVLRFDYHTDGATTSDYYFTPLQSGRTDVTIARQTAGEAWTLTLDVSLPR